MIICSHLKIVINFRGVIPIVAFWPVVGLVGQLFTDSEDHTKP